MRARQFDDHMQVSFNCGSGCLSLAQVHGEPFDLTFRQRHIIAITWDFFLRA